MNRSRHFKPAIQYSSTAQQLAHGLASNEQSRVTDWRRERRWETAELQGRQQWETGQAAVSFTPKEDGMHVHIFESLQLEGSGDVL